MSSSLAAALFPLLFDLVLSLPQVIFPISSIPIQGSAYLSDAWTMLSSERPTGPRCVPIPSNLSICYGIQYEQMRLPNLLEHETLSEAVHASSDWKSLLQLNCHPDTQVFPPFFQNSLKLFLCSLFAPICLPTMDKEILPCRSLCEAVKQGCEGRMSVYGFPWPEMLSCDKWPQDNDMCLHSPNHDKQARDISCPACSQVATYENLVDHFCRSHLVIKGKIASISGTHVTVRGGRSLKKADRRRNVPETQIRLSSTLSDCPCGVSGGTDDRFLVMASKAGDGQLTASLILPWAKDKAFKRAIHQFQRLNCKSLGREIRESASRRPHYYSMRKHNTGRYSLF